MLAYMEHEASRHNLYWHIALIYVANATLQDRDDPTWRFYFLMCVRGYQTLAPSFSIAERIAEGLLAMAVQKRAMTSAEACRIFRAVQVDRGERSVGKERQGGFILDLDMAVTDPDGAQIDKLTADFEDIALFSEFTNEIV